ncbi:hypothetical protein RW291109_047 [Cyanophage S-RIM12_RW_29_1109]|uniref:Uncharacterized protein n=4 Tax=Brizovirus syn33 TaxID=2734097 RepID=A0A1D7SVH5_9CAUD|nr:hypothetical protein Syn33_051 [Prochlorococcus phage Syn33]AOO15533.1 hypothetical protein Np121112_047 [Cyanophage S-RIM12_Np_22_1112]AOO16174.1 hypothetical protein RW040709_047 [Cyanophage S-RIM12_RW_04_0709]AOO16604.1 hypothetical protein RW071112_047 [Cyanophage S-RIM12_RW_07_1112]AOO16820.1 hypothetical protein RW140101_047 [Cyanophage S-RIM12_RW_14_0101]AOO17035.1 hypothetical protein RW220110_047 [Cyanophage S-RIM12_RW_22_0110]AOO17251.1 hypothetical protein RW250210_047 [Cyanopha
MQFLHSAILNTDEKMVLKDALLLYVSDIQKRYYADGVIPEDVYLSKMKRVEEIVNTLHLSELYRQ